MNNTGYVNNIIWSAQIVINLRSDVQITGTGTVSDPFKVVELVNSKYSVTLSMFLHIIYNKVDIYVCFFLFNVLEYAFEKRGSYDEKQDIFFRRVL